MSSTELPLLMHVLLVLCAIGLVLAFLWDFFRPPSPNKLSPASEQEVVDEDKQDSKKPNTQQRVIAGIFIVLALIAMFYKFFLLPSHLEQTSLLFIGIPALLGILLALSPRSSSLQAQVAKAISIALLASMMFAWEGWICVLMSAPLFYVVGALIAAVIDAGKPKKPLQCSLLLLTFVMSLEGVLPGLTFPTTERVSIRQTVAMMPNEVGRALERPPSFRTHLPALLNIGFPVPLGGVKSGSEQNATYIIHFGPGEGRPPGDLVMRQTQYKTHYREFTAIKDTTHIRHWLSWQKSQVSWKSISPTQTQVTWTVVFNRALSPAWYFAPIEKFFVAEATRYLINSQIRDAI